MKLIGLLGGTSWPSTIIYYRLLNEMAYEHMGGRHSANLVLRSVDFHEMRTRYDNRFSEIPFLLKQHLLELTIAKPDCILLCNNMLHKALDSLESELTHLPPVFHVVHETARQLKQAECRRILLLGTRLIMEDSYYPNILSHYDIEAIVPNEQTREKIQAFQTHIATTHMISPVAEEFFTEIIQAYKSKCDGVVLACTELSLLSSCRKNLALPVFDPVQIQCQAAFDFVTAEERGYKTALSAR